MKKLIVSRLLVIGVFVALSVVQAFARDGEMPYVGLHVTQEKLEGEQKFNVYESREKRVMNAIGLSLVIPMQREVSFAVSGDLLSGREQTTHQFLGEDPALKLKGHKIGIEMRINLKK